MISLTFDAFEVFVVVAISSVLWHFLAPIARDLGRRTLLVDRRWTQRREARRAQEAALREAEALGTTVAKEWRRGHRGP